MLLALVSANPCVSSTNDCCQQCKEEFFLANCNCLTKGKYIQPLAKMSEWMFMTVFIFVPIVIALIVYVVLTKLEVNNLLERAKTERLKAPIIYSNQAQQAAIMKKSNTEILEDD